ncbi:MAG: Lpg1974 family pore-forming outer membrane protein [Thermoguttaceae bacterium]
MIRSSKVARTRRERSFTREVKETIMVRLTYILLVLAAAGGAISVPAIGQEPLAQPDPVRLAYAAPAPGLAGSTEPDPLPGLPRPPDQPNTLFQPAPATQMYGCPDLECPYFAKDPLLDCCWGQPGWLFDVETDILGTHVINHLGENTVPPIFPSGGGANVPMAPLSWTVSPRFELGYRLPSAFGEVDVSYRFLLAHGSGSAPAGLAATPDAAAALTSHLSMDIGDVDYAAHETSLALLGPNGPLMKWRIGLRFAGLSFDSQAVEPLAAATAGSGIFQRSIENDYFGVGPHAGLELMSRREPCGLGWVGKLDGGLLFGRVNQEFVRVSTTGASHEVDYTDQEAVPMLSGFLGLDWRPPCCPNLDVLLGSTAEYWWNVGRMSDPDIYSGTSAGEVGAYGAMLRLEYNY